MYLVKIFAGFLLTFKVAIIAREQDETLASSTAVVLLVGTIAQIRTTTLGIRLPTSAPTHVPLTPPAAEYVAMPVTTHMIVTTIATIQWITVARNVVQRVVQVDIAIPVMMKIQSLAVVECALCHVMTSNSYIAQDK